MQEEITLLNHFDASQNRQVNYVEFCDTLLNLELALPFKFARNRPPLPKPVRHFTGVRRSLTSLVGGLLVDLCFCTSSVKELTKTCNHFGFLSQADRHRVSSGLRPEREGVARG